MLQVLHEELRQGKLSAAGLAELEMLLEQGKADLLAPLWVRLLRLAPEGMIQKIIEFASESDNAYIVEECLKALDYRNHKSDEYTALIVFALSWPHEDPIEQVEVAATLRLPLLADRDFVRMTIKSKLNSGSSEVRDAAAQVLQTMSGVPASDVFQTLGRGDLFDRLPPERIKFLKGL